MCDRAALRWGFKKNIFQQAIDMKAELDLTI